MCPNRIKGLGYFFCQNCYYFYIKGFSTRLAGTGFKRRLLRLIRLPTAVSVVCRKELMRSGLQSACPSVMPLSGTAIISSTRAFLRAASPLCCSAAQIKLQRRASPTRIASLKGDSGHGSQVECARFPRDGKGRRYGQTLPACPLRADMRNLHWTQLLPNVQSCGLITASWHGNLLNVADLSFPSNVAKKLITPT